MLEEAGVLKHLLHYRWRASGPQLRLSPNAGVETVKGSDLASSDASSVYKRICCTLGVYFWCFGAALGAELQRLDNQPEQTV